MPGLRETTAGLRKRRNAMQQPSGPDDDVGLTEVRGFGFNPGGLRMLTHVPDGLAPGAPLVVVLHGCTQRAGAHARDAGWLALADRLGFAVLAPEQDSQNNPNRCFNWFEPGDITRDAGETASIHAMIQHTVRIHRLDSTRVFVTGLSAGGAMTTSLLATYPETFCAGAVVAGLPYGVAGSVQEAFTAMRGAGHIDGRDLGALVTRAAPTPPRRPRLAIWHGQADRTVSSANATALALQWSGLHGLQPQPDEVRVRGLWTRTVWRDADGEALVEMNLLAGFAHGTPLAAGGDDPIGHVASFMFEAGVSSSLEIARFWGLAGPETATQLDPWTTSIATPALAPNSGRATHAQGLGANVMASVAPHVSNDVRKVIERALASAALLD